MVSLPQPGPQFRATHGQATFASCATRSSGQSSSPRTARSNSAIFLAGSARTWPRHRKNRRPRCAWADRSRSSNSKPSISGSSSKTPKRVKKPRESSASTPARSIASENTLACNPRRECTDLGRSGFPWFGDRLLGKRVDLRPLHDARKWYSFLAECMTGAGRQLVYRAWPRDVNIRQIRVSVCQLDSGTMLALPRKRGNEWAHVQNAADEVDARVSAPPGHSYWPGIVGDRDVLRVGRKHRCDPA